MSAITGTLNRLALNITERGDLLDYVTGEQVKIWQAGRSLFQGALFHDTPEEGNLVSDVSNLVSVTLIVRRYDANGAALINKTVSSFDTITFSEWESESAEHFSIPLTEVETNQTIPNVGVLPIYFVIQVTTSSGSYIAGQGYGEIINVGLSAGLPTPPVSGPYVFNGDVTVPNLTVTGNFIVGNLIIDTASINTLGQSIDANGHRLKFAHGEPTYLIDFLPDEHVHDASVDYYAEIMDAIEDAQARSCVLILPEYPVRFDTQIQYTGRLLIKGTKSPPVVIAGESLDLSDCSCLVWGGSIGETMVVLTKTNGGGMVDMALNGNAIAATVLVLDGCQRGKYENLTITGFTTGTGLQMMSLAVTNATCSYNDFFRLCVNATGYHASGTGHSCVYLGYTPATGGNACHNKFYSSECYHEGSRHCWYLGFNDNNSWISPFIFRPNEETDTGHGFHVDPTEVGGQPVELALFHVQAGYGGWYQPVGTTVQPASIYGYHTGNGEPLPVTNGTPLFCTIVGSAFQPNTLVLQEDKVSPTLQHGWTNIGGDYGDAKYYKDTNGRVWLEGVISGGTATVGTVLFQVPDIYKPSVDRIYNINSFGAAGQIQVDRFGQVKIFVGSSNDLCLDGVSWRTDVE